MSHRSAPIILSKPFPIEKDKGMKTWFPILAAIAACIPVAAQATPYYTQPGYVTLMHGGWSASNLRIQTDLAFSNPENCFSQDGYMVDSNDSGHELFSSMILSAYVSHLKISLVLDGCVYDRPHIIAVELKP